MRHTHRRHMLTTRHGHPKKAVSLTTQIPLHFVVSVPPCLTVMLPKTRFPFPSLFFKPTDVVFLLRPPFSACLVSSYSRTTFHSVRRLRASKKRGQPVRTKGMGMGVGSAQNHQKMHTQTVLTPTRGQRALQTLVGGQPTLSVGSALAPRAPL